MLAIDARFVSHWLDSSYSKSRFKFLAVVAPRVCRYRCLQILNHVGFCFRCSHAAGVGFYLRWIIGFYFRWSVGFYFRWGVSTEQCKVREHFCHHNLKSLLKRFTSSSVLKLIQIDHHDVADNVAYFYGKYCQNGCTATTTIWREQFFFEPT